MNCQEQREMGAKNKRTKSLKKIVSFENLPTTDFKTTKAKLKSHNASTSSLKATSKNHHILGHHKESNQTRSNVDASDLPYSFQHAFKLNSVNQQMEGLLSEVYQRQLNRKHASKLKKAIEEEIEIMTAKIQANSTIYHRLSEIGQLY